MPDLAGVSTEDLTNELLRREDARCPGCRGAWPVYVGRWDEDGTTLRCRGCLRAVGACSCG